MRPRRHDVLVVPGSTSRRKRAKRDGGDGKPRTNWLGLLCLLLLGAIASYYIFEVIGGNRGGARVGGLDNRGTILSDVRGIVNEDLSVKEDVLKQRQERDMWRPESKVSFKTEPRQADFSTTTSAGVPGAPIATSSPTKLGDPTHVVEAGNSIEQQGGGGCTLAPASNCRMSNPAVVILAHNRDEYVARTLRSLLSQPGIERFKVFVSVDDPSSYSKMEEIVRMVSNAQPADKKVHIETWRKGTPTHITHPFMQTPLSHISEHFRFVLEKALGEGSEFSHLIMIEDDLLLGRDFLQLFEETAWLLKAEPDKLFCVSAWNDNGLKTLIRPTEEGVRALMRTGYFPGLGWMTTREVWSELRSRWPERPTTGWDHWIRLSTSMGGKECIIPEIPRTKHVSSHGTNVNSAEAISKFAKYAFVDDYQVGENGFPNTRALLIGEYARRFEDMVKHAERIQHLREVDQIVGNSNMLRKDTSGFLVLYRRERFEAIASSFGLFPTQPRGWHKGIIYSRVPSHHKHGGRPLLLADVRKAEYINPNEKVLPRKDMIKAAANMGESCTAACQRLQLPCLESELEFMNTCEAFDGVFECENGCGHQIGAEIPCYVADRGQQTYQQCLVTDAGAITCGSHHRSTRRLCACRI
jgi:hypothetical protein